jgi:hypothetical protein
MLERRETVGLCGHKVAAYKEGATGLYRGTCYACYARNIQLVRAGKTTWEELEKQGKAAPKKGTQS